MKTLLTAATAGIILFAASASVSWYLLNQDSESEEASISELDSTTELGVPPIGEGADKKTQMPVAMRPPMPITVEAVLELSDSIRKKERELIEREKQVQKSEENIKLLFDDLKIERDQLTALTQRIESKLQQAGSSVEEMKIENEQLSTKTLELTKLLKDRKPDEPVELNEIEERVKTAKAWFGNLENEQAANYLRTFANEGELEFAAKLLDAMEKRKASKILEVLDDPAFVDQMLKVLWSKKRDDVSSRPSTRTLR